MTTPETPAKAEYTKAFFSQDKENKEVVALFVDPKNPEFEPRRPAMFGTIEGKPVSVFVEPAGKTEAGKEYGAFLTINAKGAKNADGTYAKDTKLAIGNIRATGDGHVRMAIDFGNDKTIWAIPRKELSQDLLVKAGLDVGKLEEARANAAANAAAKTAKAPAP